MAPVSLGNCSFVSKYSVLYIHAQRHSSCCVYNTFKASSWMDEINEAYTIPNNLNCLVEVTRKPMFS